MEKAQRQQYHSLIKAQEKDHRKLQEKQSLQARARKLLDFIFHQTLGKEASTTTTRRTNDIAEGIAGKNFNFV